MTHRGLERLHEDRSSCVLRFSLFWRNGTFGPTALSFGGFRREPSVAFPLGGAGLVYK